MFADAQSDMSRWKKRLTHYLECEHMEKVEKILDEEIDCDRLGADYWKFSFGLSVMGMLNRLQMTSNQTNSLESRFRDYFGKVSDIFSFDKFIFVPSLGMKFYSMVARGIVGLDTDYFNLRQIGSYVSVMSQVKEVSKSIDTILQ